MLSIKYHYTQLFIFLQENGLRVKMPNFTRRPQEKEEKRRRKREEKEGIGWAKIL